MSEKKQRNNSRSSKYQQGALIALGIVLIAFGASGLLERNVAISTQTEATPTIVTESTDTPKESEVPIEDCDEFASVDQQPVRISIPSIGVDGCIQQVGIDQYGDIAVPTNVGVAGWYVNSPMPGNTGVSIIDGHVQGRYRDGIFAQLPDVEIGADIIIEDATGSRRVFLVQEGTSVPVEAAQQELFRKLDDTDSQLTLITCSGDIDDADQFSERHIVHAVLQ